MTEHAIKDWKDTGLAYDDEPSARIEITDSVNNLIGFTVEVFLHCIIDFEKEKTTYQSVIAFPWDLTLEVDQANSMKELKNKIDKFLKEECERVYEDEDDIKNMIATLVI